MVIMVMVVMVSWVGVVIVLGGVWPMSEVGVMGSVVMGDFSPIWAAGRCSHHHFQKLMGIRLLCTSLHSEGVKGKIHCAFIRVNLGGGER